MNDDHNINDDNLNNLSPELSKLGGKNPFNPSDAYFDAFQTKLNKRIADEEDIKDLAPVLLSIPKYNPFEVPKDYFDELPTVVQEKVTATKSGSLPNWLLVLFKPRFAVPLIVTVIIGFAGFNYLNNTTIIPSENEELSLEDNLYYISESDIIDQLTADASIDPSADSDSDNSIENYLIDNNIDESNLSSEL